MQREVHAQRVADRLTDVLLILEHAPVYTAGRRTAPGERPADGTPVVDVDRGGRMTWHGPGQLVAYPIVRVDDVGDYLDRVEEAMVKISADFGVTARRLPGRGGVWTAGDAARGLPERRLGSLGVRVTKGVSMHGFSLNCANDPRWFNRIPGAGDSTLSAEAGRRILVDEVIPVAEKRLAEALGREPYDLHEEDLRRR